MITTILAVGLAFAGYSAVSLRKQNKKLKAELAAKPTDPVKPMPVVTTVVEPVNPTACIKINPTGKVVMRNDVNDIVSLFNYLMMRTDKLASVSDNANPIAEVDSFIKENMIDLRDQKGLICTDGHYLLQYGKKNSKEKFILVELKTLKTIQKFMYKEDNEKFISLWDKTAEKFIKESSAEKVCSLIEQCSSVKPEKTNKTTDKFIKIDLSGVDNKFNTKDDPLFHVREEMKYPFSMSLNKIFWMVFNKIYNEFTNKLVFAKNSNGKIFCLYRTVNNKYALIPENDLCNIVEKQHEYARQESYYYSFPRIVEDKLEKMYACIKSGKAAAASNGYTSYDETTKLKFFGIDC